MWRKLNGCLNFEIGRLGLTCFDCFLDLLCRLHLTFCVCLQSKVSDINHQTILGTAGPSRTNSGQTIWSMPQTLCGPTLVDRKSTCEPKHWLQEDARSICKHLDARQKSMGSAYDGKGKSPHRYHNDSLRHYEESVQFRHDWRVLGVKSFFDSRWCAAPICQVSETDAEASRRAWSSESKWGMGELCMVSIGLISIIHFKGWQDCQFR